MRGNEDGMKAGKHVHSFHTKKCGSREEELQHVHVQLRMIIEHQVLVLCMACLLLP